MHIDYDNKKVTIDGFGIYEYEEYGNNAYKISIPYPDGEKSCDMYFPKSGINENTVISSVATDTKNNYEHHSYAEKIYDDVSINTVTINLGDVLGGGGQSTTELAIKNGEFLAGLSESLNVPIDVVSGGSKQSLLALDIAHYLGDTYGNIEGGSLKVPREVECSVYAYYVDDNGNKRVSDEILKSILENNIDVTCITGGEVTLKSQGFGSLIPRFYKILEESDSTSNIKAIKVSSGDDPGISNKGSLYATVGGNYQKLVEKDYISTDILYSYERDYILISNYDDERVERITVTDINGNIIERYYFDKDRNITQYLVVNENNDLVSVPIDKVVTPTNSPDRIYIDYKPLMNMFQNINTKVHNFDILDTAFVSGETGGSMVFATVNEILNGYISSSKGLLYTVGNNSDNAISILQDINRQDYILANAIGNDIDASIYQYVQNIETMGLSDLQYESATVNLGAGTSNHTKITKAMLEQALSNSNPIYSIIDNAVADFIELNSGLSSYVETSGNIFVGELGDTSRLIMSEFDSASDIMVKYGDDLKNAIHEGYNELLRYMGEFDTLDMAELPDTIQQIDILADRIVQLDNEYGELSRTHGMWVDTDGDNESDYQIDNSAAMATNRAEKEQVVKERNRLIRKKNKLEGLSAKETAIAESIMQVYFNYNPQLPSYVATSTNSLETTTNNEELTLDTDITTTDPQDNDFSINDAQSSESSGGKTDGNLTFEQVVKNTINGLYGVGDTEGTQRWDTIKSFGFNPEEVQAAVNEYYRNR